MGRYGYAGGAGGVTEIFQDSFDTEVLLASQQVPVLVDVSAPWCGPCQALAPILEQLAQRYSGRVRVVKIDGDRAPRIMQTYQIRSYPTLMLFRNGSAVRLMAGSPGTLSGVVNFLEPLP